MGEAAARAAPGVCDWRLQAGREEFRPAASGVFSIGQALFAGKVRQGFSPAIRASLFQVIEPLRIRTCPFNNLPNSKSDHFGESVTAEGMPNYTWLRPETVTEVKFTEWTHGEILRHAEFVAIREDKPAREVVREI